MIRELYNWVIHWAATPSAEVALFGLAFAESSFFPIPPDVLLITMAVGTPAKAFWYALICSVGSLLGGMFGYALGRYGGRPLLDKFMKQETLLRVEDLFNRYDAWAVGIAGFTPIPYKVFTLASGAFRIDFKTFVIASAAGRAGRFFLVATALYFWGHAIEGLIERYFNLFSVIFVLLLIGGFFAVKLMKGKKGDTILNSVN